MFKAAVATDQIADAQLLALSVYGNESRQISTHGILLGNQLYMTVPWAENPEIYRRNSALTYVKNVRTPLLMRQNDRDDATPYDQGIVYFNALRSLDKPVVMLEYVGEGHGSGGRPENAMDFADRVYEFFGHFLKGEPAPRWWTAGLARNDR